MSSFRLVSAVRVLMAIGCCATSAWAGDWAQWGGTPAHNMVAQETGLPATFRIGRLDPQTETLELATCENIQWGFKLGTETHGSPVIARGRVLLGSNYLGNRTKGKVSTNLAGGWLLCLDERTGKLLWELTAPHLPESRAPHSDTGYGICSSATVEDERVYVVTNCAEVLCLDINGLANGNDGPFLEEGALIAGSFTTTRSTPPAELKPTDADILWRYDLLAELDVHPHDASSCSVLVCGDYLYVCTGNGVDRGEVKSLNPLAPSLIVLDKRTGRLVAADAEKIGTRLLKGQWSSPSLCRAGGKTLIIYGGGDGLCYAFEPVQPASPGPVAPLKKVWAVECNPADCRVRDGKPVAYRDKDGPSEIVGTPVVIGDRVYVTVGRDPHRGPGKGCVTCIDAARGTAVWRCDKIGRSMSTVAVVDGLLFVAETFGGVHCLDAATGQVHWSHKMPGQVWGSTMVADGKVYVPTSKSLLVFAAGQEKNLLAEVKLDSACYSTPTAANGVLYVATQEFLYAVREMHDSRAPRATATQPAPTVPAPTAASISADERVTSTDWPQWRGANRDGRVVWLPEKMPALKILWQRKVAGTCNAGIAVAGDIAVLADHDGRNDYYRALRTDDGSELWQRSFPNGREMDYGAAPRATPLIYHGNAHVLGAFGDCYCLELKTGKTIWQRNFAKDFGSPAVPKWGYCDSPLVAQGKLILNPGGSSALVALAPETGKLLWRGAGARANYSSFIAGNFGGVEQVIGYDAKSLGGWELNSGRRLWTLPVDTSGGYIVPTPVRVGGNLLLTDLNSPAQLFAFATSGVILPTPAARNEDCTPEISTPVVARGLVLGQNEQLICLDAAAGLKTLWIEDRDESFRADCHLIIADDRGLAFNNEGELVLFRFDRQGVRILGKKKLCGKTLMHPTVAGQRLFVRDSQFVSCYDLGH
jgi:outer membrane protein assembly factor BamB